MKVIKGLKEYYKRLSWYNRMKLMHANGKEYKGWIREKQRSIGTK